MSFEFFLSKLSPLGSFDETYGQRYWGEANGEELPISFNSMHKVIHAGRTITAEEKVMKKSSKGTTYWQLKKVKIVDNSPTDNAPSTNIKVTGDYSAQLDRIEGKLDKLLANDAALDVPDTIHEVSDGDPEMPEGFLL